MAISNTNNPPNDDWFAIIITDTIGGFNKWVADSYDVINKIAIENRYIVFLLINMSIDMLAQYAKNQNELWYNTQNEIHKNYNPYFRYLSTLHYTQNYSDDTTSP